MKSKLTQFKERNKKRNAHLYQPDKIEGIDYIICPVSHERLSMIKTSYIKNVLGMQVEEYDQLYPLVRGVTESRKKNIKNGLKQIDPATGLTKYEMGQVKARETLKQIDQFGLSGYDKKGQKTRATHMARVDEYGRNGYSRLATKAILKGNRTKAKNGLISLNQNEFKRYKVAILYLTAKYRKELTHGYVTGLAGKQNAWHIDHMYSILKGYQHGISPLVIGHRNNLKMIPWEKNISKNSNCSTTPDVLLDMCGYSKERSESEFEVFIRLINEDIKNNTPPNGAFLIERFYATILCN